MTEWRSPFTSNLLVHLRDDDMTRLTTNFDSSSTFNRLRRPACRPKEQQQQRGYERFQPCLRRMLHRHMMCMPKEIFRPKINQSTGWHMTTFLTMPSIIYDGERVISPALPLQRASSAANPPSFDPGAQINLCLQSANWPTTKAR
jgi:hypothetical protein